MDFSLTLEQRDLKEAARQFARTEFLPEKAMEYELQQSFPFEIYRKAGELGFLGVDFPQEVGGAGLGIMEAVLVVEEFCKADSGIGMAIHLGYLPAKMVKMFGTPEQKRKYLSRVVKGEWIAAVSFTEPDHGSDLTRMDTRLEEREDCFVINGTKILTTNARYADFFTVLCQDGPPEAPGHGMSTILVERNPERPLGGELEINELPHKMGIKMTSSGELVFRDLRVPKENLLGERGRGLMNVLEFLDESRIEIAAQSLGNAEGAFLRAFRYAKERSQFGSPIIDFQAIGHRLAHMFSRLQALKYITYRAAWACDHQKGRMVPLLTSLVKHYVPQQAKAIIDEAINIFGGYGYFMDQEVERRYRDNRIAEIYEGTVEIQLNTMVHFLKRMSAEYLEEALL